MGSNRNPWEPSHHSPEQQIRMGATSNRQDSGLKGAPREAAGEEPGRGRRLERAAVHSGGCGSARCGGSEGESVATAAPQEEEGTPLRGS